MILEFGGGGMGVRAFWNFRKQGGGVKMSMPPWQGMDIFWNHPFTTSLAGNYEQFLITFLPENICSDKHECYMYDMSQRQTRIMLACSRLLINREPGTG